MHKQLFKGSNNKEVLEQNKKCDINLFKEDGFNELPNVAKDLLIKMLESDPTKRITAQEALNHRFFSMLDETEKSSSPFKGDFKKAKQLYIQDK